MPCGVCQRDKRAIRHPEKRKPLEASCLDDGLEIGHPPVE
jgi:hypothetical protein